MSDMDVTIKVSARRLANWLALEERAAWEGQKFYRTCLIEALKLPQDSTDAEIMAAVESRMKKGGKSA